MPHVLYLVPRGCCHARNPFTVSRALWPMSAPPRHAKIISQVCRIHYSYTVSHATHLLSLHDIGLSRSFFRMRDLFAVFYAHTGPEVLHQGIQKYFIKCTAHTIHTQSRICCLCTTLLCLAVFVVCVILSPCLMRTLANDYYTKAHKSTFPSCTRLPYSHAVDYRSHLLSLHEHCSSRSFCHMRNRLASHAHPGQPIVAACTKLLLQSAPACTCTHSTRMLPHHASFVLQLPSSIVQSGPGICMHACLAAEYCKRVLANQSSRCA